MSLFNNTQAAVGAAGGGLLSRATGALTGAVGKASSGLASALGGGVLANTAVSMGQQMLTSTVQGAVNGAMPPVVRSALALADGVSADVMAGDFQGAALRALDSGLIDTLFADGGTARSQARFWAGRNPLFGGITPKQAKAIYEASLALPKAKKNLWLLEVTTASGRVERFNLFATEVDYSPHIIVGDKRRVGGSVVDAVTGSDSTEMRITTMDDAAATLRHWFADQAGLVAHRDGTVGVPADFAVGIRIAHGVVADTQRVVYEDKGLFRPVSMEVSLSRREDALMELQMTFTQLDTFWT